MGLHSSPQQSSIVLSSKVLLLQLLSTRHAPIANHRPHRFFATYRTSGTVQVSYLTWKCSRPVSTELVLIATQSWHQSTPSTHLHQSVVIARPSSHVPIKLSPITKLSLILSAASTRSTQTHLPVKLRQLVVMLKTSIKEAILGTYARMLLRNSSTMPCTLTTKPAISP